MATLTLSLPEALTSFVDQQVAGRGYETSSAYIGELISADQDRQRLRELLLEGAASEASPLEAGYFDDLKRRARQIKTC